MNIFEAIDNNDIVRVKELLDSGIDVNIKNESGDTLLHIVCSYNSNIEIVKLLLEQPNIDMNTKNYYGKTPLYLACEENHVETVKLLLKHPDIDVNSKTNNGKTSLHRACNINSIEIVKLLLAHPNISVNVKDDNVNSSLYQACRYNKIEIVKLLLAKPDIEIDFDYNILKKEEELPHWDDEGDLIIKISLLFSPKVRSLLKSHTHKYKDLINKILDSIED